MYNKYLTNVRIGQGAFRVLFTDAYSRRCAISGERTLPVLEAAHNKPFSFGIDSTNNGLLLRADLHKLFDSGYITVTVKYNIKISRRIKEEFENGQDYYKFHGQTLISLPFNNSDLPNKEFLKWHNENLLIPNKGPWFLLSWKLTEKDRCNVEAAKLSKKSVADIFCVFLTNNGRRYLGLSNIGKKLL